MLAQFTTLPSTVEKNLEELEKAKWYDLSYVELMIIE